MLAFCAAPPFFCFLPGSASPPLVRLKEDAVDLGRYGAYIDKQVPMVATADVARVAAEHASFWRSPNCKGN